MNKNDKDFGLLDYPKLLSKDYSSTKFYSIIFIGKDNKKYYQKFYMDNSLDQELILKKLKKEVEKFSMFKEWE